MIRKAIFWTHLIVGLVAGVVILIMSVTGVLLTYQRQMTTWADGAKIGKPEGGERVSIEELVRKAGETAKSAPTAITVGSDESSAVTVAFGRERTLFLNPYTGEVASEGSKAVRGFFQMMIDWHRWLGMAGEQRKIGKAITGACNLGFLFLVVSGIFLWMPRNWNGKALRAVTVPDVKARGKARDWNWHNVAGFWFWLPLFLVVSTATFFSYPWTTDLLYKATGHEAPPKQAPPARSAGGGGGRGEAVGKGSTEDSRDFDKYFAIAGQQTADWQRIVLRVPSGESKNVTMTIDRGTGGRPDLRSQITINREKAEIEKVERYQDYNSARKIRLWVRWIHTGEAGGVLGQTVAGLASAVGVLLVWTGFALAWRRFIGRKTAAA